MRRIASTMEVLVLGFFAGSASADLGDNDVGMNTHVPADDVIEACVDLGVGWIRVDNNWLENQPTPGAPAYVAALDSAVTTAGARGLDVYMTIAYTPIWASTGDTDGTSTNDVPLAGAYEAYVRMAVAHYRTMGVTHYGLWNEPNLDSFWEGTPEQYVDIIVLPGLAAIDQGCADAGHADCMALGPDLASVGEWDDVLFAIMSRMNTHLVDFDIYTHHSYNGFEETGVNIWDNDRFFEVLDHQRFWFTRRSFLQVLDETGHTIFGLPDREVWITETGYRNQPPMDAGEQATQETYYMRVIDEQLARQWYTNTFFYEILDSLDTLDGFGIVRRTSGPDATWNDNFDFKDAYWALRDRIDTEPAFQPTPCELQCCDGLDNDGDGTADMADPGCSGESDDDESDDPVVEIPTILAIAAPGVALDGSLDEWSSASFVSLSSPGDFVSPDHAPGDASDLSLRFALMWDATNLYVGVEVADDVHDNDAAADMLWSGDSVQAALDVGQNGGHSYDDTDDFELGWALLPAGPASWRWTAPVTAPADGSQVFVASITGGLAYEIRIPSTSLGISTLAEGQMMGFTMLVNDADGEGREGWVEWTPGIGSFKDPASFGVLSLVGTVLPADDPAEPTADLPPDPSTDASVDVVEDLSGDTVADIPMDDPGTDIHPPGGGGCTCAVS